MNNIILIISMFFSMNNEIVFKNNIYAFANKEIRTKKELIIKESEIFLNNAYYYYEENHPNNSAD